MTNQEVKDFFVKNGASPDFKIVNTPMFTISELVHNNDGIGFKVITKTKTVYMWPFSVKNFINDYLTITANKIYIYNSGFDDFNQIGY